MITLGFFGYGLFLDSGLLVVGLIGMGISLWAQARVMGNFKKYAKVPISSGMTGREAAAAVCHAKGVYDVTIERHQGMLTDHYDPRAKTLRLSPEVHDGRSVSSVAVAAHEAGHAIQDAENYSMLAMRSKMVPAAILGSNLWYILFIAGLLLSNYFLAAAIVVFSLTVVFQLITLPVEFDASKRAKLVLATSGIVSTRQEAQGVEKVLGAAAMTYVAKVAASILTLLYLISVFAGGRD